MSLAVHIGDCRDILPTLPPESVHCVVTSPPYWGLRDYGVAGQIGLEPTPEAYVETMVGVFREVRRVLRDDGTMWLNLGDSYASGEIGRHDNGSTYADDYERKDFGPRRQRRIVGLKPKDLVGIPWRVAFALQADGWFLRSDIIWAKPNPMPESVTDRPTKAHEYIFLLSKKASYYYDAAAIAESRVRPEEGPGNRRVYDTGRPDGLTLRPDRGVGPPERNARTVWTICSEPYPEAHFATFPAELARRCILAGTSAKGACGECGAPWERQTDVSYYSSTYGDERRPDVPGSNDGKNGSAEFGTKRFLERKRKEIQTTGWRPTCAHDTAPVPCTVLDPFAGSGTVGEVAERNGRNAVLIELSAPYCALIRERTAQRCLFAQEAQAP